MCLKFVIPQGGANALDLQFENSHLDEIKFPKRMTDYVLYINKLHTEQSGVSY